MAMNDKDKGDKHYVELDVLLDTRLATLTSIHPSLAEKMILSGKYYDRYHDVFDQFIDVDMAVYDHHYGHRDIEVLKLAKSTLVYKLINNEISEGYYKFMQGMIDHPPTVVVNYYPYELNKQEKKEMEAVLATIFITYDVKLMSKDPALLSPSRLASEYAHCWMYDRDQYLRPFYRNLNMSPAHETIFHFPALAQGRDAELATADQIVDGLSRLQEGLAGFMVMDFIPAFNFSFHLHTTDVKGEYQTKASTLETTTDLEREAEAERHDLLRDVL